MRTKGKEQPDKKSTADGRAFLIPYEPYRVS